MKGLTDWVKDKQLTSFFVLTFLITWGLGFSYSAVMQQGKFLLVPLVFIATCGPALAGIIITIIAGTPQKPAVNKRNAWIAFLAGWVVALGVFLAHFAFINKASISPTLTAIVLISVIPVAFIVNLIYTRFPVIRNIPVILLRIRNNIWWILLALILIPVIYLLSFPISQLFGRSPGSFSALPATGFALVGWIVLKFLYQFFFFNGTGEEVGWRGFALPRLQLHVSPLIAALILSLIWVPWHMFLWQAEGRPINTSYFWLISYMIHIPAGVIICWIFNRSRGSILVAGIAHAAANTVMALISNPDVYAFAVTLYVFVVIIVFADRMWRKLPENHPAVYQKKLMGETNEIL
jgi:membrane protease YdiL (CAAX protease family)